MNPDLVFGLQLTAVGMGTVFLLLTLLMLALTLIGRLDRPEVAPAVAEVPAEPTPPLEPTLSPPPAPARPPAIQILEGGTELDAETLAAIAVAVLTHREVRRQQAAPAMRRNPPGTLQYASRWVTLGRSLQQQIPPRR